jgi:integration host factor subunit beta
MARSGARALAASCLRGEPSHGPISRRHAAPKTIAAALEGSASMTKADLVERLAHDQKIAKRHAELLVDAVFATMEQSLHRGERIEIRGFGTFQVRSCKGYSGRNPKTGAPVHVCSQAPACLQGE